MVDLEILKIRNVLAVIAAAATEFGLSHATGVPAFQDAYSYSAFLAFLVFFLLLFWVIEKLYRWLARR